MRGFSFYLGFEAGPVGGGMKEGSVSEYWEALLASIFVLLAVVISRLWFCKRSLFLFFVQCGMGLLVVV